MPRMRPRSQYARMDAGARDKRITIQRLPEGEDGRADDGYPVEDWTPLIDLDASKFDVGGEERFGSGQLSAPYETRWGIEWRPDMDPDTIDVPKKRRIVYQGRVHDIVAAEAMDGLHGIELLTLSRRG
jgi:head-tail adaptor